MNKKMINKLPKNIENALNTKGFYLYIWITPKDLKNSIELIFLKILKKILSPIILLFLIIGIFLTPTLGSLLIFKVFFSIFIILSTGILLLLLIISIIKSYHMMKNSYIIITKSFILLNGKIIKHVEYGKIEKEISIIEKKFNKAIFSNYKKLNIFKKVLVEFKLGYTTIYKKKIGSIILIVLFFYTIYIIFMGIIYLLGIFLVLTIGLFLILINKFILLKIGHKITVINDLFSNIDIYGDNLSISKINVEKYLKQIQNNNWENSISIKIDKSFNEINGYANKTINYSIKLKKEIQDSKYKDMFDYSILNSWIKKEIYIPLAEILKLLLINQNILIKTQKELLIQIKNTKKEYIQPLKLQKTSLNLQIEQTNHNITILNKYLLKLK